ncbi:MAG: hypothetical protein ACRDZ2_11800, partial [Ilumatobacteraceae bacterium]
MTDTIPSTSSTDTGKDTGKPPSQPVPDLARDVALAAGPMDRSTGGGKTRPFRVVSHFAPAGDQPQAIAGLSQGITRGDR